MSAPPDLPSDSPPAEGDHPERGRLRQFPCESCGADFEFSIAEQSLECPYCGHVKELEFEAGAEVAEQDLRAELEAVAARRAEREAQTDHPRAASGPSSGPDEKEVNCQDCGAQVRFVGTLTSQHCPYCGTPIQLRDVHDAEDRVIVDGIMPFQIERSKADQNLKAWIASRWFAPSAFRSRGMDGKFSGVYMPYWTYDAMTFNRYSGGARRASLPDRSPRRSHG